MEAVSPLPASEGIDRKLLRQARQRFRAISAARLERVRAVLSDRHRLFLDLLPLLLHANHPALPGYVSQQTPCGINGYVPRNETLELAKRVARSFHCQRRAAPEARINAVYLMGSTGTIGQSDASDLDIWICYPEHLDQESLALLQRKTSLISRWAAELDLEAHLFLMNGEKFQRGQREPLTGENCGTAQHYLLLDEFYRTGILLAGRVPMWWLIPPEAEVNYPAFRSELTTKRHVRATDVIDFGGISGIPAGEFVGAGVWQLYKAIDSPYKSVLKLLLVEVYSSQFPATDCLSTEYKRAVYRGVTDIDELDPYVIIYRRLEEYLRLRDEPERLEIVRRCMYYKAGKKLSRPPAGEVKSWQRRLMERLVDEWGWDGEKLRLLDSRADWNISDLTQERNALVRELTYSYRFLSEFARHSGESASIDARELGILGRKLYAAFERKAGKVETLNPGRTVNVSESELSFCATRTADGESSSLIWGAYPELVSPRGVPRKRAIKQTGCLSELLSWCVLNGVIDERTRIAVRESLDGLGHLELQSMIREIRLHLLAGAQAAPGDDAFASPVRTLGMLAFVNVSADPLQQMRRRGLHRISSQTDSLGYSALRENLVQNIETVVRNSWGEVICARFEGENGLVRFIRDHLQLRASAAAADFPGVEIRSFCASRPTAIARRIEELVEDLSRGFGSGPGAANMRYVLEIEQRYHLIQQRKGLVSAQPAADETELLRLLGGAQREWSALSVDRYALLHSPLRQICENLTPGGVAVFCEGHRDSVIITVVDELGSFFQTTYATEREGSALSAIDQFLSSVRYRQNSSPAPLQPATDPRGIRDTTPRYYRLHRQGSRGSYSVRPLEFPARLPGSSYLNIQAIVERGGESELLYTVYCDGAVFSQGELGEAFHSRLASHILSLRRSREAYPAYITDLDLSAVALDNDLALQTVHYLQYKSALEVEINRALAARLD